jgi:hypothetical protein
VTHWCRPVPVDERCVFVIVVVVVVVAVAVGVRELFGRVVSRFMLSRVDI